MNHLELLKKYMAMVIEFHEADYLGYCGPNGLKMFSEEELNELWRIRNEVEND